MFDCFASIAFQEGMLSIQSRILFIKVFTASSFNFSDCLRSWLKIYLLPLKMFTLIPENYTTTHFFKK